MQTIVAPESVVEDNLIPLFADGARGENVNDAYRLERAISRIRKLINDPVALRLRAAALIEGTAKPLLVLSIVALTGLRMVAGPAMVPNCIHVHRSRPAAVIAALFDWQRGEVA